MEYRRGLGTFYFFSLYRCRLVLANSLRLCGCDYPFVMPWDAEFRLILGCSDTLRVVLSLPCVIEGSFYFLPALSFSVLIS